MGHLASANSDGRSNSNSRGDSNGRSDSSVSNTSNETGASSNASNETVASNSSNETGSSNKASHCTVASEELGSGRGSSHKGGDTEGGLRIKILVFKNIQEKLFYLHAVEGFNGMTRDGWSAPFKQMCTRSRHARVQPG